MAFDWEAAWRKAEEVFFSREVVVVDEREIPAFVTDGFNKVFRFHAVNQTFVTYQSLDDKFAFKLFSPEMTVRNVARELADKVERGEVRKK